MSFSSRRSRLLSLSVLALAVGLVNPALAEKIRLGATAGPHAQIAEALVPVAKAKGLDVEVVEFSDHAIINTATNDGELEANAFQHTPYLEQQIKDRNLDLVSVARTVLLPMAAYSRKIKSLDELPEGAQIAIPNDPTNAGRALRLLESGGIIKLAPGLGFKSTVLDITENPKNVKILELEATQVPRSLEDVDLAVINTNFAIQAGLNPTKDSLVRETDLSEYFCLIAVRAEDKDKPWVKTLVESYQSPEVKAFVLDTFKGNIQPGW